MKRTSCDPEDIGLKSFFLGPQAENAEWVAETVQNTLRRWFEWRKSIYPSDGNAISSIDQNSSEFLKSRSRLEKLLSLLLTRFEDELPKFSPRYVGHMFSEISLPALFGHIVTLLHNPNNVSGESARVGSVLELEAIQLLVDMVGYPKDLATGHFTTGGTIANMEAMIRARSRTAMWLQAGSLLRQKGETLSLVEAGGLGWKRYDQVMSQSAHEGYELPNFDVEPFQAAQHISKIFNCTYHPPVVLVPATQHYSWPKACWALGLGQETCWTVEVDELGHMSITDLENKIEYAIKHNRQILMVVSIAGSTEFGGFDPVHKVNSLLSKYREIGIHIWHHVDAAYGGFFLSLNSKAADILGASVSESMRGISYSNSVTLDPHKLGYVPYSSGTILVKEKRDYALSPQSAAYVQFDSTKDRGPFTLEGSRSAGGAVATWLAGNSVGFNEEGYGRILKKTIQAKQKLEIEFSIEDLGIRVVPGCESNILCFTVAKNGETTTAANERMEKIISGFAPRQHESFFIAQTRLSVKKYPELCRAFAKQWSGIIDSDYILCARLCIMNPFFDSKETKTEFTVEFLEELKHLAQEH